MKIALFRWALIASSVTLATWAMAQSLPLFGVAQFNQAQFGMPAPATPVTVMPSWAWIILAIILWVLAFRLKPTR